MVSCHMGWGAYIIKHIPFVITSGIGNLRILLDTTCSIRFLLLTNQRGSLVVRAFAACLGGPG